MPLIQPTKKPYFLYESTKTMNIYYNITLGSFFQFPSILHVTSPTASGGSAVGCIVMKAHYNGNVHSNVKVTLEL